jgi:hypothetical protein
VHSDVAGYDEAIVGPILDYFWCTNNRIFTLADIRKPEILTAVNVAYSYIKAILQLGRDVSFGHFDIFFEVSTRSGQGSSVEVRYLMLDHETKVVCWAEVIQSGCVGFPAALSREHQGSYSSHRRLRRLSKVVIQISCADIIIGGWLNASRLILVLGMKFLKMWSFASA